MRAAWALETEEAGLSFGPFTYSYVTCVLTLPKPQFLQIKKGKKKKRVSTFKVLRSIKLLLYSFSNPLCLKQCPWHGRGPFEEIAQEMRHSQCGAKPGCRHFV